MENYGVGSSATKQLVENSILSDLNTPQREAVTHVRGPILVLAGAGSGKTRVLTRRVANLVLTHRVKPFQILAVTFTNKATEEMRERLSHLLGEQAKELWLGTFHSLGLRVLRRHASLLSYSSDFAVYDEQDSRAVLKAVLKSCDIDEKRHPIAGFARAIDRAKNVLVQPDEYFNSPLIRSGKGDAFAEARRMEAEVYEGYQRALVKANAMDFGDLLLNTMLVLRGEANVREYFQRTIQFVLVDEFQDTNLAQYEFVKLLTEKSRNLFVVGDDDQSIYAFRGASIKNILGFEQDFSEAKIVTLEQNYRSSANILNASHAIIRHVSGRRKKKLWTDAGDGQPLFSFVAVDEREEAQFVAQEIAQQRADGMSLSGIAVFYRTNAQSRALEEAFVERGIPYRIFGGLKFYERKEVKDILSYLRLMVNDADDQALFRIINTPPRGIGAHTVQRISALAQEKSVAALNAAEMIAAQSKPVQQFLTLFSSLRERANRVVLSNLIEAVIQETEYRARLEAVKDPTNTARLENLNELVALGRSMESAAETPREVLSAFLDRIALTAGADEPANTSEGSAVLQDAKKKGEMVSLMTLHLAKGLEFPIVFFTGLEEGLLPHYLSLQSDTEIEEERRLCYVGMTRAMRTLYLTRALSRGMFGSGDGYGGYYREQSRFLADVPEELIEMKMLKEESYIEEADDLKF